jgi:hypothetical protein
MPFAVRICLYVVLLAALAAALVVVRPQEEAPAGLREVGTGDAVLKLDGDGVLRSWDLTVYGRCDDGGTDGTRWHPADNGAPARVRRLPDGRVHAVEADRKLASDGSRRRYRIELLARMSEDVATVDVAYRARYDRPNGRRVYCGTPPQRFRVVLPPK